MDRIIKYKNIDGWDALNNILEWFGCPDHPVQIDEISRIIDRTDLYFAPHALKKWS